MRITRFIAALGVVVYAALLGYGIAQAGEQIAVYSYTAIELRLIAESNRRIERQAARGSRVYSFDMYQINEGPNSLTVGIDTAFRRDAAQKLYVTDMSSNYTSTFSRRATIERKNNIGEQIVKPDEPIGAALRNVLILHGARLVKVVNSEP